MVIGANLGVFIAHTIIKKVQQLLPIHKYFPVKPVKAPKRTNSIFLFRLLKNDTGRAILRVISGPKAFKVVLFSRLTPIPFGLQNTIFGVRF